VIRYVFRRTLVPYPHGWFTLLSAGFPTIAVVVMATVIAACSNSEAEAPSPPLPEVDAAEVVTKSVRQWDEFTGRITAIGAVDIRTRVSGYIDRIAFKEGDMVNAGDLLFVVDPRPYRAAHDSAVAQLERARASAQLAEAQYKRAESLIKGATISLDTYDTRRATLGQASADVRAAEAAVATAKLNLDFTEVRSPIAGKVSRALLTLGNLVQADQTVLTSVVSQDPVYVYFQPDEQSFLRYGELARKGERANSDNAVRVGLASETGFPHSGAVNFVNNQVDAATGTINVRATVPNPDGVFVPGLYARVQLEGRADYTAMLIDDKAVMTDQDRKYVYVLGPDDKAKRKDIVLGRIHDGLRVVQSGLDANDKIIVGGLQKIFAPDTKVKPNLVAIGARPQS
jgi:membrane fusion protein, multidrug efflux system